MAYEIIPLNKQLLLEKFTIKEEEQEVLEEFFLPEKSKTTNVNEIFKVISYTTNNNSLLLPISIGDLVVVENYSSLGYFNKKEYFVAHENAILAKIINKKDKF